MKKISIFTILLCCGLGKSLTAADQAPYPILPAKEEIQQAVVESDIVTSRQLVPQLAQLIAEYADNTIKGYLTLSEFRQALPLYCYHPDKPNDTEWQKSYHKEYPQSGELQSTDWAVHWFFASTDPQAVTTLDQAQWIKDVNTENRLPEHDIHPTRIPLKFLENKKEGDEIRFSLLGKPYCLICNQRALNPEKPENFEDALAKVQKYVP